MDTVHIWSLVDFHSGTQLQSCLTVASPDLSQVTAALAGFFAELDDVAARRLRSDGHLGHSLFPIAEVHRQYHLKNRGIIRM